MSDMYQQNYQNLFKLAHRPLQIPFYRGFFEDEKEPGTSFQATFFTEVFNKKFYFSILYKLDQFH